MNSSLFIIITFIFKIMYKNIIIIHSVINEFMSNYYNNIFYLK